MADKVLIVTGGLISGNERSLWTAFQKWRSQFSHARAAWLDVKVKLVMAEPLAGLALEKMLLPTRPRQMRDQVRALTAPHQSSLPVLGEVVLMTLLAQAGMAYETLTLDALFAEPDQAERLIRETNCVFLSTTYLHDLSELEPIVKRLKREHNHLVLGGALAGIIHNQWEGMPEVDILAIGYGELLVEPLVDWIRSGFSCLTAPASGRLVAKKYSQFLYSGVPTTKNLDFLTRPDWSLAQQYHRRSFKMIYYESVRGCPYRCSFCNYPYLFDDTKFRYKSAQKVADDWERYLAQFDLDYIICLDSLFTMPRQRLREFCQLLVKRRIKVKWVCYARADDLADEETVAMMKEAGAHQVQIGIESGDPALLQNMNKACTVEANRQALVNCRRYGLTSVISLIVGYPGETAQSLERTYQFLESTPPDFYFLATFSTRVAGAPLLQPELKRRFGLRVMDNLYSMAPYWQHATMSCSEVGNHVRALDKKLMRNKVALNAILFYGGMLAYRPEQRDILLDFQSRAATRPGLEGLFNLANRLVDQQLAQEVERHFQ